MPDTYRPMLAVPTRDRQDITHGYHYEFKWDGVRAIVTVDGDTVRISSRRGTDVSASYPELAGLAAVLPQGAVLDGEIVAFDDHGRPSFPRLQQRMHVSDPGRAARLAGQVPAAFLAFDLLELAGTPRIGEPYLDRRAALTMLGIGGPRWQVPPDTADLDTALTTATSLGLEGVVAKRPGSPYRPGVRSPDWRKLLLTTRQEFVVGGIRPGRSTVVGSLLIGVHDDAGTLRYAGSVGSGLAGADLEFWREELQRAGTDASPFGDPVPHRDARYLVPAHVVEVRYREWTPDGVLRHPVHLGRRTDRDPVEVVREDR